MDQINDLLAWLPAIVTLLGIGGAIVSYSWQKRTDRGHQLIELRRTAYRTYISALINQIDSPTKETLNKLHIADLDLFVVASDDVVAKVGAFSNYMSATSYENAAKRDRTEYKVLLTAALLAMRRDCFEKAKLPSDEALRLLPFE